MNEREPVTEPVRDAAGPVARVDDLVLTELGGEVLVYDKQRHQIHHLNQTSAVIWRLCDGTRSVEEVTDAARASLGEGVDGEVVRLALMKLDEANLLARPIELEFKGLVQSRRTLVRRAAIAGAVAVPAIVSLTAPAGAVGQCPGSFNEFVCTGGSCGSLACCCPPGMTSADVCLPSFANNCTCIAPCVPL